MGKSLLLASNTNAQTITGNYTVDFGQLIRRYGCNIGLENGNVLIRGNGYYDVDVNLTIASTAAGTVSVQIYQDGVAVPGANATTTVIANSINAITVPTKIRQRDDGMSNITVVVTGGTSITNASIGISKE